MANHLLKTVDDIPIEVDDEGHFRATINGKHRSFRTLADAEKAIRPIRREIQAFTPGSGWGRYQATVSTVVRMRKTKYRTQFIDAIGQEVGHDARGVYVYDPEIIAQLNAIAAEIDALAGKQKLILCDAIPLTPEYVTDVITAERKAKAP